MTTYSATIIRRNDRLAIAFRDSDGHGNARTGFDWPATDEGLEDAKQAIKNDNMACSDDFDGIDGICMPDDGGESISADLSGEGDA